MMSRSQRSRLPFLLYGVLGTAVLVYFLSTRDSDEERVSKRLDEVGALVEKSGPESNLDAVGRARRVGDFFLPELEARLIPWGEVLSQRSELVRALVGARNRSDTIGIEFRDKKIEVTHGPGKKFAEVHCVVAVTTKSELGRSREQYRFTFFWIEEGGEWWLDRVDLVEILEGSPFL